MRRNKIGSVLILIAGLGILLFTDIGTRLKGKVTRYFSENVTLDQDQLPLALDTYTWELEDMGETPLNFESLKGQVVLVNFWATWCGPCIAEMPSMQLLYNDYGKRVAFLFITDEPHRKAANFLEKRKLDLPVYFSESERPRLLRSKMLPTTYIIDKNGMIVVAETGAMDWNSPNIRKLLDTLLAGKE